MYNFRCACFDFSSYFSHQTASATYDNAHYSLSHRIECFLLCNAFSVRIQHRLLQHGLQLSSSHIRAYRIEEPSHKVNEILIFL